ncbi:MAG: hypothetical protein NT038_10080 [Euryarchaeota archaeon]|nr:hypothetical protein [Euryarchaeota archaeon]
MVGRYPVSMTAATRLSEAYRYVCGYLVSSLIGFLKKNPAFSIGESGIYHQCNRYFLSLNPVIPILVTCNPVVDQFFRQPH